jgi:hypothetical protein
VGHHEVSFEIVRVMIEDVHQPRLLELQGGIVAKSKVNDASVRQSQSDNELAEIPIVGEEDASFASSEVQHVSIGETRREIGTDANGVVSERAQEMEEASIGALIEQEAPRAHALAETAASDLSVRRARRLPT